MTYMWKCRRRGGASGATYPFSPSSWTIGSVLYIARNKPKWCCCNVWMFKAPVIFPVIIIIIFFASPANVCHIDDIKRGAADRKPWSSVLKLSSFFGRHMIRVTGMRNPDAGAGSAKICTTGCQAPQLVTACLKPRQGRRVGEKSSRAK